MRILTCYLPADSGTASIAGFSIDTHSVEVRRRIGYLPENNPLYLDMGAREYLAFIGKMREIPAAALKAKLDQVISVCGLESMIAKDVGELSKGFRQRLGLAQALIHDPEVLILDEPTIGLDPHQIIEIRNLIKAIGKEKTVILSSHILPEVAATCDRVLIINKGKIVGSGTPEELAAVSHGGQAIIVSIRGPQQQIAQGLQGLEKVTGVKHLGEDGGLNRFELLTQAGVDLSEAVFFLVARSGWSMTELYRQAINLEDVFLDLTTREA
jgi:ABC-2 type transport system ATP-binding protein